MSRLRLTRFRVPAADHLILVLLGLGCLVLGALGLAGEGRVVMYDSFGTGELLGWCVLALATGGLVFGARDRRPPLVASGLVGSAALLGAGPVACAAVGAAGAIGGLRRLGGLAPLRIAAAAVVGWSVPGLLLAAAALGGPTLPLNIALPLADLAMLWALFALVIPVLESLTTRLVLDEAEHVDPTHMIIRRFEPQSVLAALAVLAAITYATVGPMAAVLVLVPAAAAGAGFRLQDDGQRAVAQTLTAMTVLPEWVGLVDRGHTHRVRDVVERVCTDLGLESRLRRDIVRAAELHELGHLDGGVEVGDRGRIARSGAAVLEQADMVDRVVRIVDATDPERLVGPRDADVDLGAAIVTTACDLDRMGAVVDVDEAARRVRVALGRAQRSAGAFL